MDESRKQFERYIKLRGMSAMKRDGAYVESATRFAFDIWKASRAAIEIELPSLKQTDSGERYVWSDGVYNFKNDAITAIESAGIKVKK